MKKRKKKTKTENAGNFHKPGKIFARVMKFRNPCEIFFCRGCEISHISAPEFDTKIQSAITFSSKLRFARS